MAAAFSIPADSVDFKFADFRMADSILAAIFSRMESPRDPERKFAQRVTGSYFPDLGGERDAVVRNRWSQVHFHHAIAAREPLDNLFAERLDAAITLVMHRGGQRADGAAGATAARSTESRTPQRSDRFS